MHFLYRKIIISYTIFSGLILSQIPYNPNMNKILLLEKFNINKSNQFSLSTDNIILGYSQSVYYNNNLPNFENHNGLYFPKGTGSISSLLFQYRQKYFLFSIEPQLLIQNNKSYLSLQKKEKSFSVLNDVPINDTYNISGQKFNNTGIIFYSSDIEFGYGNWNQWWGPGIHNSLVMSNNSEGMSHYFFGTKDYNNFLYGIDYSFKYTVSDAMRNKADSDYFLTAYYFNLRYKNFEIGKSRHILSGGNNNLYWNFKKAANLFFSNKFMSYWDQIIDYYISVTYPESNLILFLEFGFPNRTFKENDRKAYNDHAMASNIGLRKYGIFDIDELIIGFEYTRLVQSTYYDLMPSPNWYDNIKYDYSSFRGRRWAAHSGADSDDFLFYSGYINERMSFILGFNYERHGVTYHFPPEVKLESKITFSYKIMNYFIYVNYENEYYEHYGFIDNYNNVWSELFESGSIQRTQTILLSIEKILSF